MIRFSNWEYFLSDDATATVDASCVLFSVLKDKFATFYGVLINNSCSRRMDLVVILVRKDLCDVAFRTLFSLLRSSYRN